MTCRRSLLLVALRVLGLVVVLLARVLVLHGAATAARLSALRLGRVVALHLASAHRCLLGSRPCWSSTAGLEGGSGAIRLSRRLNTCDNRRSHDGGCHADRSQVEKLLTNAYAARRRGDVEAICAYFVDNP